MEQDLRWRFPDNNYTNEYGLDTSDMETFKKDPIASLAREICQNSIDASDGTKPTIVEFELFTIERERIPGVASIEQEIAECYEYKKDSAKECDALKNMLKAVRAPEISCLRISDFNTTGIAGAKSNARDTAFYNLTKGSGVSDKAAGSGGSKGIGKFASFVVSKFNTVFYSTQAVDTGAYIGICKLRSRPLDENEDLMTMGIGYFGQNNRNYPILEELTLDPGFHRKKKQLGTDVYIIGFKEETNWVDQIVSKILDSFMVALLYGELEVRINGIKVNKDTVGVILNDENQLRSCTKYEKRRIVSQYELLQGNEGVYTKDILIKGEKMGTVYMKRYPAIEMDKASNQCVMVRYPYMQILYSRLGSGRNLSGLCVIGNNELNNRLREIENPQHTDWEIKRLNDDKTRKKETKTMKKELEKQIEDFTLEVLRESNSERTDLGGAGEFLPSQDSNGDIIDASGLNKENLVSRPVKRTKDKSPKVKKSGENGEGYEFSYGSLDSGEEDVRKPKKNPSKKKANGNPDTTNSHDPRNGNTTNNDGSILKKVALSGIRFKTLVQSKDNSSYACVFKAPYDEKECDFSIRMWGEGQDKYEVPILSATINDKPCKVENGVIKDIKLKKDQDYVIRYKVSSDIKFASEVIMHAYRE